MPHAADVAHNATQQIGFSPHSHCFSHSLTHSLTTFIFILLQALPDIYPLKTVRVQCHRRIGIKENQWKRWSLQIQSLLTNRDGTLLDGIYLWKKKVDREFEGVEECSICYSVLHVVDHSLPKVSCNICNNSFHSACLYKWFSNANKSTCPLCRSEF